MLFVAQTFHARIILSLVSFAILISTFLMSIMLLAPVFAFRASQVLFLPIDSVVTARATPFFTPRAFPITLIFLVQSSEAFSFQSFLIKSSRFSQQLLFLILFRSVFAQEFFFVKA